MEQRSKKVYFRYSIAVIWTTMIVAVCMVSATMVQIPGVDSMVGFDKLGHFGLYLIAAVLWMNAFFQHLPYGYAQMITLLGLITIGVIVELMQAGLTTDRHFEYYDILANAVGCSAGVIIHPQLLRKGLFS